MGSNDPGAQRRFRCVVFCLYFFFGVGYSVLVPLWEASDEPAHYRLVLMLVREGRFPLLEENHEAAQPRLYYWLASGPLALLHVLEPDSVMAYNARLKPALRSETRDGARAWDRLIRHEAFDGQSLFDWNDANFRFVPGPMLLRWLNLLLGGLTLALCHGALRHALPDAPAVAGATLALIALTPQFLHVSASVSNDPLANLAGALLFWLLCRAAVGPLSPRLSAAALLLAPSLPFLTKLTLLPIALATFAGTLWNLQRFAGEHRRRTLAVALGVAGVCAAALLLLPEARGRLGESAWQRAVFVRPGALWLAPEIFGSFARSYWGTVGWMSVELPGRAWLPLTLFGVVGVLGSLRLLVPSRADLAPGDPRGALGPPQLWWLLWLALVLTVGIAGKNALASLQAQGRYLFPSIGVLSLSMTAGWCALWPRLARGALAYVTLAAMIVVNLWMWLGAVLPVYYQPFLD